jgi:hypothetical protein
MSKRRPTELRSSNIPLSIHRYTKPNLKNSIKEYWGFDNIQPYFPPIEKLFKTSELERVTEYGISFHDEKKQDLILVSSDGCLAFVIATALMCCSSIVADNITIDKEVIKSKMALIQSFTSDIVIPRRFIKILNNFFLGEHN